MIKIAKLARKIEIPQSVMQGFVRTYTGYSKVPECMREYIHVKTEDAEEWIRYGADGNSLMCRIGIIHEACWENRDFLYEDPETQYRSFIKLFGLYLNIEHDCEFFNSPLSWRFLSIKQASEFLIASGLHAAPATSKGLTRLLKAAPLYLLFSQYDNDRARLEAIQLRPRLTQLIRSIRS